MAKPEQPFLMGRHAGRALADVIANVVIKTRAVTVTAEHEARRRHIEGMMDDWEGNLGEWAATFFQHLEGMPGIPASIQHMIDRANKPVNQTDFIVNLIAAIGGAFGAMAALGQAVYRPLVNSTNTRFAYIPLSPADAADAVVRLGMSLPQGYSWAAQSAIDADAFGIMTQLAGEPPPLDELRQLMAEGRLTPLDFNTAFRYSRVRNDFRDTYVEAHSKTMSAADVVEGYIKGRLPRAEALPLFVAAGGRADQFDVAANIAGNPIGVEQAGALFNHGLITDEEYTQVILHSRINPEFEAIAKLTRFHFLTAFQIERMLTQGHATAEEATRWLIEDGLPPDQVAGLVAASVSTKGAKTKTLSVSVVTDNYEAGMLSQSQAIAQLRKLGYDALEAETELAAYDAKRILTIINQGISAVRKAFMADRLTNAQASAELDSLGVHPSLRDHYLALWHVEIKAELRTLTAAQIGSMYKKGIISEAYAVARWETMGYSAEDSELLAYEYGKPVPHGKAVK